MNLINKFLLSFFEQIVHVETAISILLDEGCYLIRRK